MRHHFYDYSGKKQKAAIPLEEIIACYKDGYLVWSRDNKNHQIRYGLQTRYFKNLQLAATEFAECLEHLDRCEGK